MTMQNIGQWDGGPPSKAMTTLRALYTRRAGLFINPQEVSEFNTIGNWRPGCVGS